MLYITCGTLGSFLSTSKINSEAVYFRTEASVYKPLSLEHLLIVPGADQGACSSVLSLPGGGESIRESSDGS